MALELDGHSVRVALSADEALRIVDTVQPLCVLLDFSMPGMDGLDLARRIKEKFGEDVVMVAISGADASYPRVAETFALVDHHFTKPAPLDEIRKILGPDTRF